MARAFPMAIGSTYTTCFKNKRSGSRYNTGVMQHIEPHFCFRSAQHKCLVQTCFLSSILFCFFVSFRKSVCLCKTVTKSNLSHASSLLPNVSGLIFYCETAEYRRRMSRRFLIFRINNDERDYPSAGTSHNVRVAHHERKRPSRK